MKKNTILTLIFAAAFSNLVLLDAANNIKAPQQKQAAKKKPAPKKTTNKPAPKKVESEEPKDTVKVTFGRNIVNLRTFTGWIIDRAGKWVSSPNRIPFENTDFNNQYYHKYKLGTENIKQINIVEIKIDTVPYYAIIIEQDKGSYRNKNDTDFRYYIGADYFLINREDFQRLWDDSMKMDEPYEVTMKVAYAGLVGYRDIKLRPKYMTMELNKDIRNREYYDTSVKTYIQFGLMPVQNKKGKFMRVNYGLAYAKRGQVPALFDFEIFKSRYYEVSLDLFHHFARPKGIVKSKKQGNNTEQIPPGKKEEPGPIED